MHIEDAIRLQLQKLDPNPHREGLIETPARMAKAWAEWTSGYHQDAGAILKCFEDGADGCDQMVVVRDIPIYSHCVVGSTFVETPGGRVRIRDLKDGTWIYTMDPKTQELELARCRNPRITRRNAPLVAVSAGAEVLICTPDHRVLTMEGAWVEAQHLVAGQRLASLLERMVHTHAPVVSRVDHLDHREDVWCLSVPTTQLFFANGLAVHNCEHHLASIFGTATIGYLPNGKIVGLSKLSRLADMFARRLQVQERMTNQIADALAEHLEPLGCGVVITARHMCMESRGVCQQGTSTVTSALRGSFRDDPQTRAEFLTWTRP